MTENWNVPIMKINYTVNGKPLDHTNFTEFLIQKGRQRIIPYDEKYNKVEETNEEIIWKLSYNGGWGLGYSSYFTYNKLNKLWHVCANIEADVKEFLIRMEKYEPDIKIVDVCEDGQNVTYESKNISDIVEYGCYYGLEKDVI